MTHDASTANRTQAEILAEVIDRAWISNGYANRWYARRQARRRAEDGAQIFSPNNDLHI